MIETATVDFVPPRWIEVDPGKPESKMYSPAANFCPTAQNSKGILAVAVTTFCEKLMLDNRNTTHASSASTRFLNFFAARSRSKVLAKDCRRLPDMRVAFQLVLFLNSKQSGE